MRDARHRPLAAFVLAATLAVGAPASGADDEVVAAKLARDAEDLLSAGKTDEACAKLSESVALDPRSTTALDLGLCRARQDRIGSAYRAYALAEKLAKEEKRDDRARTARNKKNALTFKVPKLTVNVAKEVVDLEGLVIHINDEVLPREEYGKSWAVDPGKLTVKASAPGHKTWTTTIEIAERARKSVSVPALEVGEAPAPQPAAEPASEPAPDAPEPAPEPAPEEPPEESSGADEHEDGRLVVEIGALGGFLYSAIARGSLSDLQGVAYDFEISAQTQRRASCGNTTLVPGAGECEAFFEAVPGALVGGQAFVGWAFSPRFHFGARFFGAARFPEGFYLAGGPAISGRVAGPLWLGASFLLGTTQHIAALERAEGSVPPESQGFNDNQQTVPIPLETLGFTDGEVDAGLLLGGNLELSLAILGASPHALLPVGEPRGLFSGALMLSIWPQMIAFTDGFAFAAPGGISYRFH